MSLLHILPAPICTQHQLQARDLLQSAVRWNRDDLRFLRAVVTRFRLNRREAGRLAELRHQIGEITP